MFDHYLNSKFAVDVDNNISGLIMDDLFPEHFTQQIYQK